MTVPKRTLTLANQLSAGMKTGFARSEIVKILINTDSDWSDTQIKGLSIVDEPCGSLQNDDEYVDQVTGYLGDDFSGTYYYKIEDTPHWLAVEYSC